MSHSEVESYLGCRRKHYYGYGLSLQRRSESSALAFGGAGHEVLQAFYEFILAAGDTNAEQLQAFDGAIEAAQAAYDKLVREGFVDDIDKKIKLHDLIFRFYIPNEPMVRLGWTIQAVEQEFTLEYDTETQMRYPFIVDIIALDPTGKTVVVDHKFLGQFYSDTDTELMPQIPKYIGALRGLNYKVDYGAYNLLKTTRIVGKKSKAFPDGEGPTLDQVLKWIPIKPNSVRVQRVFIEQIRTAAEIQAIKDLPLEEQEERAFRATNKMTCQMCSFRDLCVSELTGSNSELVKKSEFKVRERKAFDTPSEDAE